MPPETPEQKKQREAAEAAAKNRLPAPTPEQVQANLPNVTVGAQTRGAGGVRLIDQKPAPAGKELIGMRSGVPIYADAEDVYGAAAPQPAPAPATQPTSVAETGKPAPVVNAGAVQTATPSMSTQQTRDAYQTSPTASAVRAQQTPRTNPYEPVNRGGFFSKEYAQQFRAAQAAANQRAIDRIGAPRQDRATSTTATSNAAASALRNAAAQPRVATTEQVRAAGFGPEQTKRLMFGVGNKGESVNVTPDYLERLKNRSLRNY